LAGYQESVDEILPVSALIKLVKSCAHLFGRCGLARRVVVVVVAAAGLEVWAELATLQPVADAEIREQAPTSVFGGGTTVVSGGLGTFAGNATRRALIRFDPGAEIPAGATIVSVEVGLSVVTVPSSPANSIFELRRVRQEWLETGVSWNFRLGAEMAWQVPGAGGAEDIEAEASSTVAVGGLGRYTFPSSDRLVADVQSWVDEPETNHGWLLMSQSEGVLRTARHFASRESAANQPEMAVEYTVEAGVEPPLLRGVRVESGAVEFTFGGEAGASYTVEYLELIGGMEWTVLTNVAAMASAGEVLIRDDLEAGRRFYRVRAP
jgi:hypothetical protein